MPAAGSSAADLLPPHAIVYGEAIALSDPPFRPIGEVPDHGGSNTRAETNARHHLVDGQIVGHKPIIGWAQDGTLYVLDHVVLWGSPGESAAWSRLDDLLKKRWKHPLSGTIGVDAAAVDSGDGDWTAQVYAFCFPRSRRLVKAIKGVSGTRPAIMASEGNIQDHRIWIIGVDGVKASLMD